MQKGFSLVTILILTVGAVVFFSGSFYLMKSKISVLKPSTNQPVYSPSLSPISLPTIQTIKEDAKKTQLSEETAVKDGEEVANWKIFTNDKMGVEFKYPQNIVAGEVRSNSYSAQHTVEFSLDDKNKKIVFDVGLSPTESVPPFMETNVTKNFNGTLWKVLTPDENAKYCDAGVCSHIDPSYYVFKNGALYNFIYYPNDLKETAEKILSTFKIIGPVDAEGKFCSARVDSRDQCPERYRCQVNTNNPYPDVSSGKCVKK